jgi:hypothetical protein
VREPERTAPFTGLIDFGKYQGTTKFLDRTVSVWQTDKGTFVLPAIETVGVDVVVGPRMHGAANVEKLIAEEPRVRDRFPGEVTVEELVREFGEEVLVDGRTVREVAKVLPADAKFTDLGAMVDELSEREAAVVRTSLGADAAVSTALGLEGGVTEIGGADVGRLESIPSRARMALVKNGIGSVADLAAASPEKVGAIMANEGVPAMDGDPAGWTRYARTLMRLR